MEPQTTMWRRFRKALFPAITAALLLIATGLPAPAQAAIVYVTYTGTVAGVAAYDISGVFGSPGADLHGATYTANYTFDSSLGIFESDANRNEVYGGTDYCCASPSLGATITINGHTTTASVNGDALGDMFSMDNQVSSPGVVYSTVGHTAMDQYGHENLFTRNRIVNQLISFDFIFPLDLTASFSHTVSPDDYYRTGNTGGYGTGFFEFLTSDTTTGEILVYAAGFLAPRTITVSSSPSLPGTTADNPLLPETPATPPEAGAPPVFDFAPFEVTPEETVFIDPVIAVGYDYIVNSGPNIASVLLPTVAGDDGTYELFAWNPITSLFDVFLDFATAGNPYDFVAGGVDRFRVLGIDEAALLDPTNPVAFVTGLTFVESGTVDMSMIAVTDDTHAHPSSVPEPGSLLLLGTGLLALLSVRRKLAAQGRSA